ncbi:hypothetical protein G6011_08733 [Alternaria panax]|uniref:BHLH domain-containing protein n=1 Tax=Alternaria panax TaxID=48097 RepID=A0AAD4FIM3_9PLEO|nr:hypothetical protein G6011_08733 [Alternaria panax]
MDFSNLPAIPMAANNPMYSPSSDAFPSPDEVDVYLTESYSALSDYGCNNYENRNGPGFSRSITPGDTDFNWSTPVPDSYINTPSLVTASNAAAKPLQNAWSNYNPSPLSCPADFQHAYTASDFPGGFASNPSPLPTPPSHGSPISPSPIATHQPSPDSTSLQPPPTRKRGRPRLHRPASEPSSTTTAANKVARTQCMPHTEVERKYREKLNAELERLRRAVPMLPQCDNADTGAVKPSVGVGDSTASPTSALLLSVLQESTGRIATILFAHRLGTALEPECKMFRLAADLFNDTAMVLDCLSPAFPKPIRVAVLSFSSCLRALCGVCAGSAKASLSAHFARKGNLGEVNAKDSSQETVVSLLGMLTGSLVVSHMTSPFATWTTLVFLLAVHLATNYAAVKAVSMNSLSRQRANILFSNIFQHGVVLSPSEVSKRERIFHRGDVLRWSDDEMLGHCKIGASLQDLLGRIGEQNTQTGSLALCAIQISELLTIFTGEAYMTCPAASAVDVSIVLKAGCGPNDQLKAWAHALLLAKRARDGRGHAGNKPNTASAPPKDRLIAELRQTLEDVRAMFDKYGDEMRGKGWDLDVAAMETRAGTRLQTAVQQVG